jgi:VanZ family protein
MKGNPLRHAETEARSQENRAGKSAAISSKSYDTRVPVLLWAMAGCCVLIASVLPARSELIQLAARLPITDGVEHFSAYLVLSFFAVMSFQSRRRGILAGLSMFAGGYAVEVIQYFGCPTRAYELRDVVSNGAGVACGLMLAQVIRGLVTML